MCGIFKACGTVDRFSITVCSIYLRLTVGRIFLMVFFSELGGKFYQTDCGELLKEKSSSKYANANRI